MLVDHLVLAGGGHTHALILLRWVMNPRLKPQGLITLINRDSTTVYSGMFPGVISGNYHLDETLIDLRYLADRAGVSFILGEINSLDIFENRLFLEGRPPISFSMLSLNVGSETVVNNKLSKANDLVSSIRPFRNSYQWIKNFENKSKEVNSLPFTIVGSGFAAIEIVFALRKRWPNRKLRLQVLSNKLNPRFKRFLKLSKIKIISSKKYNHEGPCLFCTGSKAPKWLEKSSLKVNKDGRVLTNSCFQVKGRSDIFAVGDCGVITSDVRPSSGVWAVRAALPLAKNIERSLLGKSLLKWRPQYFALQLVGGFSAKNLPTAWLFWGPLIIGPYSCLWRLKQFVDRSFMRGFSKTLNMQFNKKMMACRGCAAKVAAQPLQAALKLAEIIKLDDLPEDAALVESSIAGGSWFQSVDGFPALVSDPWLNARLTTLHACSDLWARGASVTSAQAVITLPPIHQRLQKELLTQSLAGIKSALDDQGAQLVGGHTFESRSPMVENIPLGIEISLSVNGLVAPPLVPWDKAGLKPGDDILLSRGLGSGVIFAAAMHGGLPPKIVDETLWTLSKSQHDLFDPLVKNKSNLSDLSLIHACTDITGFGLLGHLGEMIQASNANRVKASLKRIKIKLFINRIPSLNGAKNLFKAGYRSTFSPSNRIYWNLLKADKQNKKLIELDNLDSSSNQAEMNFIKELLIDPQTCGPLVISCDPNISNDLINNGLWERIGVVEFI